MNWKILGPILLFLLVLSFDFEKINPTYVSAEDFSSNPPPVTTGAPGEGSCIDCHSGSTLPASGVVSFYFSGSNNFYVPDQTYSITIGKAGSIKSGFEMTALDGNNYAAGDFMAGPNSQTVSYNGRNYIRHSASSGINSWTFNWNSPAVSVGDITFYYSFNESNSNNSSLGDKIYLGSNVVSLDIASENSTNNVLNREIEMSIINKQLTISFNLNEESSVYFVSQQLSGQQMDYHNFGKRNIGRHVLQIDLDAKYGTGIYLFTIFLNNKPFTSKIKIY